MKEHDASEEATVEFLWKEIWRPGKTSPKSVGNQLRCPSPSRIAFSTSRVPSA
ncbi:unnamed protein product [Linum tenue]|nr:unnamed protein product [Linum tenue]